MKERLRYFSSSVCQKLKDSVDDNLNRYLADGFRRYEKEPDWAMELGVDVDPSPLQGLSTSAQDDAQSSMLVWKALSSLPPSLAIEGRIWTRLAHIECIDYARTRWIGARTGEDAVKIVRDHFFADTRTRCRDDNAIGRLWWTAYVAYLALPAEHEKAIAAIWTSADIRRNVVERPWISSRPRLAAAIVRAILNQSSVTSSELAFRNFMKSLNARGGGMLFEVMTEKQIDEFIAASIP